MLSPEEAIATLARGHREVHALLAGISLDDLEEPATIGGGEWSANDLVGHLTSWEEIALATVEEWRADEEPAILKTFSVDGTDDLNADEVARKSGTPVGEQLVRFDEVHGQLVAVLESFGAGDEWTQGARDGRDPARTIGALLGGVLGTDERPFDHISAHLRDLRAFSAPRAPG
jgi:hypothetical protein